MVSCEAKKVVEDIISRDPGLGLAQRPRVRVLLCARLCLCGFAFLFVWYIKDKRIYPVRLVRGFESFQMARAVRRCALGVHA